MNINYGGGLQKSGGPGVLIELTGDELALAIFAYIQSQNIIIKGARTVSVNGYHKCEDAHVFVDPSGCVDTANQHFSGRGLITKV